MWVFFQEVHIHVGSHTVVLTRKSGDRFQVKYNEEEQDVYDPILLDEEQEIYVYPQNYSMGHQHIKVVAKRAGVSVEYGRNNVKVQVSHIRSYISLN